jgi:hypothetical protein
LILGGPGRIVLPGLSVVADPIMYPFRHVPGIDPCRIYEVLDTSKAFKLSLAGIYELNMMGVTGIVIRYKDKSLANSLKEALDGLFETYLYQCNDSQETLDNADFVFVDPRIDIHRINDLKEYSRNIAEKYGFGHFELREGSIANLAVFNSRKPPLFFITRHGYPEVEYIYKAGSRVESLIRGENIIVDSEEHLLIVEKHLREAYDVAESIAARMVADRGPHHP